MIITNWNDFENGTSFYWLVYLIIRQYIFKIFDIFLVYDFFSS